MSLIGSGQLDRLKATVMVMLPFLLIAAVVLIVFKFLLFDRTGAIRVVSDIPGAEILVNSSPANQQTDATIRHLRPDNYDISLFMEGYIPSPPRQLVQVKRGKTAELFFKLLEDTTYQGEPPLEQTTADSTTQPRPALSWVPSLDSLKKVQEKQRKADSLAGQRKPSSRTGQVNPDPSVFTAVAITSSQDGAMIVVDDVSTGFTTPANLILNKGTHTIKVVMDGYQSDPALAEIVALHAGQREEVHFRMTKEQAGGDTLALVITTEPVDGRIYLDDRFCAMGEYRIKSLNYGEYLVSFGSIDGYTTPESQKIVLSEAYPHAKVIGAYRPIIYVMAGLDEKGQLLEKGIAKVISGVFFQNKGFSSDNVRGPAIKYLEGNKFYAWEFGYADAELNPPGNDGLEFVFNVPKGFDPEKKVKLRIYGYASNHNYPFTFLNKTEIAIYINGNGLHSSFKPKFNVDEERALGYDEFDVSPFLKEGENHLLIRTTEASRCFYYLNKIILL